MALCGAAHADGTWSVGAAALVTPDPYIGYKSKVWPVPMLGYEGDSFYFRGLSAGYYLWNDATDKLSLTAFYSPLHFRAKDSDDARLKKLDNRNATLMAGVSWQHDMADFGALRMILAGDTLDNSNGITWDNGWLYRYTLSRWLITPALGIQWNSANHNNYYYGVSSDESRRSGLSTWDAGSSWNPYVELTVNYAITDNLSVYGMGRYVRPGKAIKDSPMVDSSWTGALLTGVTYKF